MSAPSSLRILLIDDDEDSPVLTRAWLSQVKSAAFDLEWANTYEAGLAALRQGRCDVCLLDYRLGARDGLELLREAVAADCRTPIIMMTGEGDNGIDLEALKAGAGDYLVKGLLSGAALERAMRYAIERRRVEEQGLLEEARLRLLTAHLPLALWTTDCELRFTSFLGGGLLGPKVSPDEVVGRTLYECFQPGDSADSLVAAHCAALRGESASIDCDWQGRTYLAHVEPFHRGESQIMGAIAVALDVTDHKNTEEDLRAARKIQRALLPAQPPMLAGFDIAGVCYPAAATGGDYFDYLSLPDGSVGVVIADVSKHGFAPALIMAGTRQHLRTLAKRSCDIGEILTAANQAVAEDTKGEHFVTLFFAQFDPRTRSLVYAGAGHEAYVLDASGGVKMLESTALPLGVDPDAAVPRGEPSILEPGQVLVLLTDGIGEAMAPDGSLFRTSRALDIVQAHRSRPAGEILDLLYRAVQDFCRPNAHFDDITAVIVKVEWPIETGSGEAK